MGTVCKQIGHGLPPQNKPCPKPPQTLPVHRYTAPRHRITGPRKVPDHQTTGSPDLRARSVVLWDKVCQRLGHGLFFSDRPCPCILPCKHLRGRFGGQGLQPKNKPCPIRPQTLPQTTTDFASTFRRTREGDRGVDENGSGGLY